LGSKKLGRGLNSLLGSGSAVEPAPPAGPQWIDVDRLRPNSEQPRGNAEKGMARLAESIRQHGILQPILVAPLGTGDFEIIAGERRWRAAQAAGLRRVPVILREPGTPDRGMLELALIENIQREDLDPIERAKACRRLMVQYGLTQEKVAERLGYERSTVANLVRLLELPPEIQESVSRETITAGHARALLRLNGLPSQKEAFARIVREGWSVRATEEFVSRATQGRTKPLHRARPRRPAWVGEMQERITRRVGVQAEVRIYRRGGGRLVLPFSDLDELDRLSRVLGLPGEEEELLTP